MGLERRKGSGVRVRVIGPGRAGSSLAAALAVRGAEVVDVLGRRDDQRHAADGVDVLVVATPDDHVAEVAAAVEPRPDTVVVHLSGSLGLDVLAPHPRRGSLHPLVPLPDPTVGRDRLLAGPPCAVDGDPLVGAVARLLGARVRAVPADRRTAYHAAACIAANHIVALFGQVERVAAAAGLPVGDFVALARAALDDVERLGPAAALTGPAARGDRATVARHRTVLDPADRVAYDACVALARRLACEGDTTSATVLGAPATLPATAATLPATAATLPATGATMPAAAVAVEGSAAAWAEEVLADRSAAAPGVPATGPTGVVTAADALVPVLTAGGPVPVAVDPR